ncbi:MAG: hypothetical protein PHI19_01390 [Clostridia bacterium]|nr:hypothetical protein [Clostridia bacterium]
MKHSKGYIQNYAGDADVLFGGDENLYFQTKKEKASPYNLSYLAAWNLRPRYEDPYVPVQPKPGEPKRNAVLIILCILMVALITVFALSYFVVMPDYTALFQKVGQGEGGTDKAIALDDVINSTMRKLAIGAADMDTAELDFYTDCLENIDSLGIAFMIGYYAMPVAVILTLIIALYVLVKALMGISTRMKRKKFTYIILLQLLFSLLGIVSGFVWSGVPVAEFLSYLTGSATTLVVGIGYFIILGIEVLALILSFFAYKSKAQVMREAQMKADEINRKNLELYNRRLGPNAVVGNN